MTAEAPATANRRARWVIYCLLAIIVLGVGLFAFARLHGRRRTLLQKGFLYLRNRNPQAAAETFRTVLAAEPDNRAARLAMVDTLAAMRDFEGAQREIDAAVKAGENEAEAALIRAKLLAVEGEFRLRAAGKAADAALCDSLIADCFQPAIELVEKNADAAQSPALAYGALGDLYMSKSGVLLRKWSIIREAAALARSLNRPQEAAENDAQALALLPDVRAAQQKGTQAYGRSVELDPALAEPRLALARHALSSYVPDPARAKALLEPIVEREPKDLAARLLLASAAAMAGKYDEALEQLAAIDAQGSKAVEVLAARTQVLVEAGRWEEADAASEQLLKAQAKDPAAVYMRGKVLLERGRAEESATLLQNAVSAVSQPWPDARYSLAQALAKLGRREQALAAFKQVLDEAGKTLVTSVRQGRRLRDVRYGSCLALARELMQEDPKAAAGYAVQALALYPGREEASATAREALQAAGATAAQLEDVALLHVMGFLAPGDLDGALGACDRGLRSAPADGSQRLRLVQARLLVRKGSYVEAVAAYDALRKAWPDKRPLYELAALYVRLGRLDEARGIYQDQLSADAGDAQALAGLVSVLVRAGDRDGVRDLLVKAEKGMGADAARAMLLRIYLGEGKVEEAVALARDHAQAHPQDAAAHVMLAELLWRAGRLDEARASYDEALKVAPDFLLAYRRGLLDLQQGKAGDALALFQAARERFPGQPAPLLHVALAMQAEGRLDEAAQFLQDSIPQERGSTPPLDLARWYLAVMRAGQGNTEAALAVNAKVPEGDLGLPEDREGLLRQLAALQPPGRAQAALQLNLAEAFTRAGNAEAAQQPVAALGAALPGEPLPAIWHAQALVRQGQSEEALAALQGVVQAHPESWFARAQLASVLHQQGDTEQAIHVLEEALSRASEKQAAATNLSLGQLYDAQGNTDMAVSSYQAALEDPGVAPLACNNLAYLMATRQGEPAAALPLAQRALELGGPRPEILDTLGWIECLLGNFDDAVPHLEAARKAMPQTPTVRYHLGTAYAKAGRTADAKSELQEALAISRDFPEAAEAAALLQTLP